MTSNKKFDTLVFPSCTQTSYPSQKNGKYWLFQLKIARMSHFFRKWELVFRK